MDMDWEPEIPGQFNTPLRIRRLRSAAEAAPPIKLSFVVNSNTKEKPADWEPEIPGQFNTPLRIRRKRDAAEAGLLETVLDTRFCTPSLTVQSINPQSDYFVPITSILVYTFRIFHQICSVALWSAKFSRKTASAFTGSRHIIEIRNTATNGFESVKRRAIGSGIIRPVAPTAEQITRTNMPLAQPRWRRSSRRDYGASPTASLADSSIGQNSSFSHAAIEQVIPIIETPTEPLAPLVEAHTHSSESQIPEASIDREVLGAKLWARFTPPPIPGARGILANSQQSTLVPPSYEQSSSSSNPIDAEMKPIIEKSTAPKHYNMSSKFEKPEIRIKSSLKSLPNQHELRNKSNNTKSVSKQVSNRRSLPQLSASEMEGSLPLTRSYTISETPRQVRFAINDTNGLPQVHSVRFYKDSKVGEWVPSSPWADEQALASMSDLTYNLDALLREDSWLPPPSTPVVNRAVSHYLEEGQSSSLKEDVVNSPEDTDSPSDVSSSSIYSLLPNSVDLIDDLDQQMIDEDPIDESPIAQALIPSPIHDSPYTRIKELVKDSFRKVFPSSPRVTNLHRTNIDSSQDVTDNSVADDKPFLNAAEADKLPHLQHAQKVLDHSPANLTRDVGHTLVKNEYDAGLVGSPIEIHENIGSHDSMITTRSRYSTGHPNEPDGSKDSRAMPLEEEGLPGVELERVMKSLKMSTFGEEKLKRQRVVAAARRAANQAAAAKAKAEAEEAERKANNHRRQPKEKLVKPLGKDWEVKISEAMDRGDNAALTTTVTGTELRRKDFMTVLGERQWLNDEIINAYLEWVVDYANKKAGKDGRNAIPKVIAHNSFFYKNLSDNGAKSVSRWMKRKKAEGKKLLEVETVLIPVNNASHWTIIVVSPKERTIEYLDSFSGASKVFVHNTKAWLREELGNTWREEEWRVLQTRSAVQNNGYDCGVFCITNAECVAGGVDTASYDGSDMTAQRQRIAGVLLNRGFGGDLIPAEDL